MNEITYSAYERDLGERLISLLHEAREQLSDDRYDELFGTGLMSALDGACDLEYELER